MRKKHVHANETRSHAQPVLFTMCAANDGFFACLYALYFGFNGWMSMCTVITMATACTPAGRTLRWLLMPRR
jgi:hypothetical protein